MPLHIELRGRDELGERVALVELARLLDLRRPARRHRLASLVVLRVVREHRRLGRPVLVELRRKLDEVARHVRAGERRDTSVSANMPCSAWPNSWNIVVTSSKLSSAGWPGAGFVKFATLKTTGFVPSSFDWSTKLSIQAPPFLLSRLK